jgi:hypothetical protein
MHSRRALECVVSRLKLIEVVRKWTLRELSEVVALVIQYHQDVNHESISPFRVRLGVSLAWNEKWETETAQEVPDATVHGTA